MILKGREKLVSNYTRNDMKDFPKVANMINGVIDKHFLNKIKIDYLINYRLGEQPILSKEKVVRPEINNIVVVNHAQRITREIVGYFLGTPIQYIQNDLSKKDDIDELNRMLSYEGKESVDMEIAEYQSITGTAYRIIYTDGEFADEVPFENKSLNPSNTFVIYENTIAEKPLAGVTYLPVYDDQGDLDGYKFYIYTDFGRFVVNSDKNGKIDTSAVPDWKQYNVGGIPIVEYPNNMWRVGDWELLISIMDSINKLQSGRLDDVDQLVQALLVFLNAEITAETYDEMREAGAIMITNKNGSKTDVKSIVNTLDHMGMHTFAKELESTLDNLAGVPSRDSKSGGGADTGEAVDLRDGWFDLEILSKGKEAMFKRSERRTLKILLTMLKNTRKIDLKVMDIDIKFTRNKNHNMQVKSQSYATLIGTQTISPEDALTIVDLVMDANEYAQRGEDYWANKVDSEPEQEPNTPDTVPDEG